MLRRLHAAADWLEAHATYVALVLIALMALSAFGRAASRLIWYDEIVTYGAAALPHWRDVWNFYAQGLDTPSPISSLLVHATMHWPGSPEINIRLPFLLAFLVMLFCMYLFLRRRYPAGFALAAILIPIRFDRWFYYAFEARAYAFLLAGTAIAMVCWQAAPSSRRPGRAAFGVWLGLALAIFAHAFAIFLFIPFAAGQWVRDRTRRAITWSMWLALLLYPIGYLPVLPGEQNAGHFYRAHFFARPHLTLIPGLYRFYLGDLWFFVLLFMVLGMGLVAYQNRRALASQHPSSTDFPAGLAAQGTSAAGFSTAEWVFVALLAALPAYAVPGAMLLGAIREPYVVPFNIGLWLLLLGALAEALRRRRLAGGLLLVATIACLVLDLDSFVAALQYLPRPGQAHLDRIRQVRTLPLVQSLEKSDLPILVGDHVLYAKVFFYADPALRAQLFYAVDPVASRGYDKAATVKTNFDLFGSILGFHTVNWTAFSRQHDRFLLFQGNDPFISFFPYLEDRMQRGDPIAMKLIRINDEGTMALYDVQLGSR
ncbi:MAG: hypothetical protein ACRYFU_17615 [Janthinobacterium lividum]